MVQSISTQSFPIKSLPIPFSMRNPKIIQWTFSHIAPYFYHTSVKKNIYAATTKNWSEAN